jgi:hypothetical protein
MVGYVTAHSTHTQSTESVGEMGAEGSASSVKEAAKGPSGPRALLRNLSERAREGRGGKDKEGGSSAPLGLELPPADKAWRRGSSMPVSAGKAHVVGVRRGQQKQHVGYVAPRSDAKGPDLCSQPCSNRAWCARSWLLCSPQQRTCPHSRRANHLYYYPCMTPFPAVYQPPGDPCWRQQRQEPSARERLWGGGAHGRTAGRQRSRSGGGGAKGYGYPQVMHA